MTACCMVSLLGGCSSAPHKPVKTAKFNEPKQSDLQRVWEGATVALPVRGSTGSMITNNDGSTGLFRLTGASPGTLWPVIVVLPGCGQQAPVSLMRSLAEQGFVLISPDSQRRFFNPLTCLDLQTNSNAGEALVRARQTEIAYASAQLQHLNWVDRDNIFLIGLYDGAAAVARYVGGGYKARILAEWGCQGSDKVRGISNEVASPIFAATSSTVPTYSGDCSQFLSDDGSSQVLVLPSKYSESILLEPVVYTQLLRFFDRQLFK